MPAPIDLTFDLSFLRPFFTPFTIAAMLRSAVLRSAGAVTARIARPTTSAFRASPLARQSAAVNTSFITSPWKPVIGARLYSAGGALNQQEVEQRITTLLGGFDKVNDPKNVGFPGRPFL